HSDDIPTKILRFVFIPLYAAAAAWDYMATRIVNSGKALSLVEAWEKQRGIPPEESVEIEPTAKKPSKYWQIAQPVYNISNQVENLKKATIDPVLAQKKVDSFEILGNDLRNMEGEDEAVIKNRIAEELKNPVYRQHRNGFFSLSGKTSSDNFLEKLPNRISSPAA
ncbi:MAG: hypothetical protein H0T84_00465, partial [Tatlockia sp.]|nr:hypothetical protein [Tatlockia sp.]